MLLKIKFPTKNSGALMYIFLRSGATGLQKFPCFKKYYNVPKWENRFTLGLNATKITDYIEKRFK